MKYQILTTKKFDKAFSKLDRQTQKIIKSWIEKNLSKAEDPRIHGKGLTANSSGQWRYRIGVYRLLCDIQDDKLIIVIFQKIKMDSPTDCPV